MKEKPAVEVRLDKWLWAARFYKTRALAREMIEGGKVHYNGQRSKPSKIVELNATLTLRPVSYTHLDVYKRQAEYLQRFGFPAQNIVHTESLALGSASFTPMQVARGYAVMANGGFLVDPWFISKIENDQGGVIFEAKPKVACPERCV